MRIFGMGMPELIVILVVILIIFGPKNLPKLGSALGKAVKGVREGVDSVTSELDAAKTSVDNIGNEETKEAAAAAPVTATAVVEEVPTAENTGSAETAGFCSKCGTPLEADAQFCKKCGAAIS